jgi:hypothetical protein
MKVERIAAMDEVHKITDYRFTPDDLMVGARRPGVSAFMRVRDGAFSVEAAIRSHIALFDEIVAVHNRSTDGTPEILERLQHELGPKLRVYHYVPPAFPPGSDGHAREAGDSLLSFVNYSNFALARTRYTHATKLDDDHVAMGAATAKLVADVRAGRAAQNEVACFSGLNLARDEADTLGILRREPYSGSGDIGIFPVTPTTHFVHDRRFEMLRTGRLRRRFHSFVYWHLKYLKPGHGFANYDLAENPRSRYAKRLRAHHADRAVVDLDQLARLAGTERRLVDRLADAGVPVPDRDRVIAARGRAAAHILAKQDLADLARPDAELAPFLAAP